MYPYLRFIKKRNKSIKIIFRVAGEISVIIFIKYWRLLITAQLSLLWSGMCKEKNKTL